VVQVARPLLRGKPTTDDLRQKFNEYCQPAFQRLGQSAQSRFDPGDMPWIIRFNN
jgi:hypothetical protein